MKKVICLILALMLSVNFIGAYADNTTGNLSDIVVNGKQHWAYDTIMKAANTNIIVGYPDGTFRPNNNVEVDAYIKMVICALGNNFENGMDYWASPFIEKAIELKLLDSNEFNTYRRSITREEAAMIIVQALATTEKLPSEEQINKYKAMVPDYIQISDKYKQHVLYAYATGMITGDTKGNFNPKDNLTRAEAATVIMRLLDESLRKPILLEDETANVIPELLKSDEEVWGREDIYNITSSVGLDDYRWAYTIDDGKIYFNDPPIYQKYELENRLNPDISEMVYKATKTLIDDEHYVYTSYANFGKTRAFVGFAEASQFAFNNNFLFQYIFYEKENYNAKKDWKQDSFSDNVYITLELNSLWREFDKNSWSTPFYETKLKHSLMAVFGEIEGKDIYNYIYGVYIDKRTNPSKYINKCFTKTFPTVQVDLSNDDGAALDFYFSKVR